MSTTITKNTKGYVGRGAKGTARQQRNIAAMRRNIERAQEAQEAKERHAIRRNLKAENLKATNVDKQYIDINSISPRALFNARLEQAYAIALKGNKPVRRTQIKATFGPRVLFSLAAELDRSGFVGGGHLGDEIILELTELYVELGQNASPKLFGGSLRHCVVERQGAK